MNLLQGERILRSSFPPNLLRVRPEKAVIFLLVSLAILSPRPGWSMEEQAEAWRLDADRVTFVNEPGDDWTVVEHDLVGELNGQSNLFRA